MREDSSTARKLGLTPILVRLAWSFVLKGGGTHYIEHKDFDNVVVSELYAWTTLDSEGQAGMKVEFRVRREVIKTVEFGARVIGGRGNPIVRQVI
jgi:hypothetical protein